MEMIYPLDFEDISVQIRRQAECNERNHPGAVKDCRIGPNVYMMYCPHCHSKFPRSISVDNMIKVRRGEISSSAVLEAVVA